MAQTHSPAVRVPVAVDVATSRAAGRGALKNILIHRNDLTGQKKQETGKVRVPWGHFTLY